MSSTHASSQPLVAAAVYVDLVLVMILSVPTVQCCEQYYVYDKLRAVAGCYRRMENCCQFSIANGSQRIIYNWLQLLNVHVDNYTAAIYNTLYWLIVVLFAFVSEDCLFMNCLIASTLYMQASYRYCAPC